MDSNKMRFPAICWMIAKGIGARYFWFRLFGYGVHVRFVDKDYQPLFSERYGFERVLKIGRFWIKGLKP